MRNTANAVFLCRPMRTVFSFILLLFHLVAFGQLQRNYTSYTVDNGLAQNTVWDAFQDYKGFMWFGTADGVNRFDGYTMHTYKTEVGDSNSIYGITGFNFFEDSKRNLWIGHDRGLSIYDRVHNKFINLYKNPNGISIIGIDTNEILWTVSAAKYIYGFDLKTLKIKYKIFINQNWHNSYGSVISSVKIGSSFFIGFSESTCLQFYPYTRQFKVHFSPVRTNSTIHKISANRFCSFLGNSATIYTVINDSVLITTKKYPKLDTSSLVFSGGLVFNNKLYTGGSRGLFIFNIETLDLEEHITNFTNKMADSYSYIQTVRKDRSGNLYLCSNGGGVYLYSPYRNKFRHYTNYSPKKSLFKSIVTTEGGKIFAGTFGEGLTIFEADGSCEIIKEPFMANNESIGALYKLSEREILLTMAYTLIKYDLKNKSYKSLPVDQYYFSSGFPFYLKVANELWLNRNTVDDAAIFDVFTNRKILEIKNNTITCFKRINSEEILLGTKKGLLIYNLKSRSIVLTDIKDFVKSICILGSGEIYIGTIVGLYIMRDYKNIITHFTAKNGLINDFIYGVLEDNRGDIWFSHNKGVSQYFPKEGKFIHYGVKDGLQSNEFNTGAYYKDEKGLLYFGGVNGINVIDPSNIVENKNTPQIAINEILLGDMPYKSDTAYNEIKSLTLSYLENTLSFDFSALEFSQPENNIYQYRLSGYDNNWIQSGTRHFARYANLPPGEYVFEVMAANADGFWNKQPRSVFISIIPPFWQRKWFYWLMGFLGFAAIGAAFYAFNKRQQRKLQRELDLQQKLEQERLRISRDLHDNVGAQLSYLITNVEWMLQHPDKLTEQDEQQRLQAMSEAGRNAILTLRQTIWAISHKELTVDDFADRFKQFVLKMLEFDKSVQVHFNENILPDSTLSPAVALNLFRICQEAFNNCLKHAQCKNIYIQFESTQEVLFCYKIVDDGIGFDWEQAKQKGHYGLVNMEARAKETQAGLTVASEIGNGTTLTIILK